MIAEDELFILHETLIHADHQFYRRIRVKNDFESSVSLLNHAFQLPPDPQSPRNAALRTLSMSLWCRSFLLKLFSVESELMRRIAKKQDLGIQLDAYRGFYEEYQRYWKMLSSSSSLPQTESVCPEDIEIRIPAAAAVNSNQPSSSVNQKIIPSPSNAATALVAAATKAALAKTSAPKSGIRRPFETLKDEVCPESVLYGTKTGRTIKYRRNTDNNSGGLAEVQYEETNPTCVLNRLEQAFCDDVGKDVIMELETLLERLEEFMKHRPRDEQVDCHSNEEKTEKDDDNSSDTDSIDDNPRDWRMYCFQNRAIPVTAAKELNKLYHNGSSSSSSSNCGSLVEPNQHPYHHCPKHPYRKPVNDCAAQLILYIHFFLGVVRLNGLGSKIDNFLAFKHFLFSADLGLDLSQGEVGHIYDTDSPFVSERELECESTHIHKPIDVTSFTMDNVSYRFSTYLFLPITNTDSDRNSNNDNKQIKYETNEIRLKRMHQYLACFYYSLSANQGYAITQSIYALLMETIDVKKSIEYYRKAADQGLREAVFNLGNCHFFGSGVPIDYKFAFECFQRGCELGDPDAILSLAECYSHGLGVDKDYVKAIYYYKIAAQKGDNPMAMYNLGAMYFHGMGIEANPSQSFEYFLKAAKLDYPLALQRVAICYLYGVGVKQDDTLATKYFLAAADNGVEQSYLMAARRIALGQGIRKDLAIAFHFLQLSACLTPTQENNMDEATIAQAAALLTNTAYAQAWSIRFRGPNTITENVILAE